MGYPVKTGYDPLVPLPHFPAVFIEYGVLPASLENVPAVGTESTVGVLVVDDNLGEDVIELIVVPVVDFHEVYVDLGKGGSRGVRDTVQS